MGFETPRGSGLEIRIGSSRSLPFQQLSNFTNFPNLSRSVSSQSISITETEWKLPSPRVVGMILVILTETALFTIFVVAYLFYIGKSISGPYPHEVLGAAHPRHGPSAFQQRDDRGRGTESS